MRNSDFATRRLETIEKGQLFNSTRLKTPKQITQYRTHRGKQKASERGLEAGKKLHGGCCHPEAEPDSLHSFPE